MTYCYITQDIPIPPSGFTTRRVSGLLWFSCLTEKHMMPLHADHDQVIKAEGELVPYDCDEILCCVRFNQATLHLPTSTLSDYV